MTQIDENRRNVKRVLDVLTPEGVEFRFLRTRLDIEDEKIKEALFVLRSAGLVDTKPLPKEPCPTCGQRPRAPTLLYLPINDHTSEED